MSIDFSFDLFLSYSSKDKAIVRTLAKRLRHAGLKVWFDEWVLRPGDNIPAKIEEGLEHSRVLVLCMSANAFGSNWAQLEAGTFRFRDPLNKERCFIPLRLDDAPIKGSLAQFLYVNWRPEEREQEYAKLLAACRPPAKPSAVEVETAGKQVAETVIQLNYKNAEVMAYAFSPDGKCALTGSEDSTIRLWNMETGRCVRVLKGHTQTVRSVVLSSDQRHCISGSHDKEIRLWDLDTGRCLRVLRGHSGPIKSVTWSHDERRALSCGWPWAGDTVRLWDMARGYNLAVMKDRQLVSCAAWSADQTHALLACNDHTVQLVNLNRGHCVRVLEGHTGGVETVTWNTDKGLALSGSVDNTLRLWEVETGRCIRVLEGHTDSVTSVAWAAGGRWVISGSIDHTLRLWDLEAGCCLRVFHNANIKAVAWSADGRRAVSGDRLGSIRVWDLSELVSDARAPRVTVTASPLVPKQVQYTNAKVLLVGESGAGKTGLSRRLASDCWEPSDSTVGAWATQWKLPVASDIDVEREIWLWDFGGQADQRLIHQLYMDETALAVLVFDGQKEDLFETLGQWDRDLSRASRKEFAKLLVAGCVDAGGLRVSRSEVEKFAAARKFRGFLETSAKQNLGCEELKQAVLAGINWDEIPCRTTEVLFKRLKEEILRLKDEGRVLMRFNELRETLQLRLSGEVKRFSNKELSGVLTLLTGPGIVWELEFGSWVLLQPERINAYAQAVIRTLQADEHQRGCLMEERVLKGDLLYESSMERLAGDEERFVLLAMHQTLVERGLCLRQPTDRGNLLVFPSYYRRERPDLVQHPAVHVSYRFSGFLDEIYATLVVWLHHSKPFQQKQLWRYAADFTTNTEKQLGIKMTHYGSGAGDLEVYFDPSVTVEEKIIFGKYIHEHLLQHALDVERLRHYVCPNCGTPVGNREVAMKRLNDWLLGQPLQSRARSECKRKGKVKLPSIVCVECEKRVPLWDDMEQCFANPGIQRRVREMQDVSANELSNQSKERALVGEVISTVALADQISRELTVSDQGIDMEIEFIDDELEATGRKLYLQLKSGDSYLYKRRKDGAEIFTIKNKRWARYWMAQAFPVLLVIRNAEGEVRWMEVRDWLKRASDNGKKSIKRIIFKGERFDVMSVRRWREKLLSDLAS